MIKVLTILNSLDVGGIEKTLLSCMDYFGENQVQVDICCFERSGKLEKKFLAYGVRIFYLKKTGSTLFDAIQLSKILNKHPYHVVHSRLSYTSAGFAIAARLNSIPFFLSIHNEFAATLITWKHNIALAPIRAVYLKWHKYITLKLSKKIIGHSKANLDRNYKNWKSNSQFVVVYNGVDYNKLSATGNSIVYDCFTMVHIGSFRYQKNHLFLIDCFKELNPQANHYKLVLIGDGGLREEIIRRIEGYGLKEHVLLLGVVEDIGQYMKNANLFIFPSLFEGFANVLIEAQFMELPICASDIKPHYESVYSPYHPYFLNPVEKDQAVRSLRKIIEEIQQNSFASITHEAKDFVIDNFSIQKMSHKLVELYRSNI